MKIAAWNVNSVRARLERLLGWLAREAPDVLCLQETKATDADFPYEPLQAAGYTAAVYGQRTYNGVAVLTRRPPESVRRGFDDGGPEEEARLIAVRTGGVHVLSAYAPNGKMVGSESYAAKLAWFDRLGAHLRAHYRPTDALVLCGDLNVAPDERDVERPEFWRGTVLFHPSAREALGRVTAWGLVDLVRLHHEGQGPYSWWDYRALSFAKNDGLRIDHALGTAAAAARCTEAYVDREARKGEKPSDHAPVVVVLR